MIAVAVASAALSVTKGIMDSRQQQQNADAAKAAARARQRQAEYNAEIMRQNQGIADRNADNIRKAALEETERKREENERFLAHQRAAFGASGVQMEGTPLAVMGETAAHLELDALETWRQGKLREYNERGRARSFGTQAELESFSGRVAYNNGMNQASIYSSSARNAMYTGFVNAGQNLLSGASKTAKLNSK
jgi:hypothetical protein